jgi:CRISP-associated protein Cas1
VHKNKVKTIAINKNGYYLSREKGCLVVNDEKRNKKKYPLFDNDIGTIILRSGNMVSSGALASCCFWNINTIIATSRGHPVGIVKSLYDDSHVETRISQYESLRDDRCLEIAKTILLSKLKGHEQVIKKYGLKKIDFSFAEKINNLEAKDLKILRRKLLAIEGHEQLQYFNQVFSLFNESVRPEGRKTYKAYDAINNVFNLCYKDLSWRVHIALIKAKLEPYLGYLHGIAFGTPSLICDFMEIYRYLVDDFVLSNARKLEPKNFVIKDEDFSTHRKGKREYVNDLIQKELYEKLNAYYKSKVEIPRIRRGEHQEIETLISEEALLFAKYLRNERKDWMPRTPAL